jgi:hypothetical protein
VWLETQLYEGLGHLDGFYKVGLIAPLPGLSQSKVLYTWLTTSMDYYRRNVRVNKIK